MDEDFFFYDGFLFYNKYSPTKETINMYKYLGRGSVSVII